jgi:hypothetical protein
MWDVVVVAMAAYTREEEGGEMEKKGSARQRVSVPSR